MKRLVPLIVIALTLALSSSASAATTIGSLPAVTTTGSCSACGTVQATDSGPNVYTSPVRGVITSFSVRSGTVMTAADNYRIGVYTPVTPPNWTLSAASPYMFWPGTGPAFTDRTITWDTRVSIMAGDHIGLSVHDIGGNTSYFYNTASTADTLFGPNTAGFDVGSTSTSGVTFASNRANVQAKIEPDADLDGYGDETQDGCPADRAEHGPCIAPVISDFKFSLNKFVVNTKGAVMSAAATAKGSTVILSLSKAARVSFELKLKAAGRTVGKSCKKQTSKNRTKKKCTRYPITYKFARDLPTGTSNLAFSGRIKVGAKTKTLAAGKYLATASPHSAAANLTGPTAATNFTVAVPKKKRK